MPLLCSVLPVNRWRTLRHLRETALLESPAAFASSYDDVSTWTPSRWRTEFDESTWFVARLRSRTVGLVRSRVSPADPAARYVESLWVRPEVRVNGVARTLVNHLLAHEAARSVDLVHVWFFEGNRDAESLYRGLDFVETGDSQPLSAEDPRIEVRLQRDLRGARC